MGESGPRQVWAGKGVKDKGGIEHRLVQQGQGRGDRMQGRKRSEGRKGAEKTMQAGHEWQGHGNAGVKGWGREKVLGRRARGGEGGTLEETLNEVPWGYQVLVLLAWWLLVGNCATRVIM
ncbi:hypothetical protein EI94DRAFT_1701362 [Lactarius quietus]|nr:hypothetical protein EI94DRAFT_1701362 [Lactarius quietus]